MSPLHLLTHFAFCIFVLLLLFRLLLAASARTHSLTHIDMHMHTLIHTHVRTYALHAQYTHKHIESNGSSRPLLCLCLAAAKSVTPLR